MAIQLTLEHFTHVEELPQPDQFIVEVHNPRTGRSTYTFDTEEKVVTFLDWLDDWCAKAGVNDVTYTVVHQVVNIRYVLQRKAG